MPQPSGEEVQVSTAAAVVALEVVDDEEEEEEEEEESFTRPQQLTDIDRDIRTILHSRTFNAGEKYYRYYNVVITHLYKADPKFNPDQFTFEIHKDPICPGEIRHVIKRVKNKRVTIVRKVLCSLAVPSIGAAIAAFLRRILPF